MPCKTIVISILAGPGAGKSVLAAEVFAELKKQGHSAELITEYVKRWAWQGLPVSNWMESLYIFGKQLRYESTVWGKVDYIVTDSPLGLPMVYEHLYDPNNIGAVRTQYEMVRTRQKSEGVVHNLDLHLMRQHSYQTEGRYEADEQAAIRVDQAIRQLIPANPVRNVKEVLEAVVHCRRSL